MRDWLIRLTQNQKLALAALALGVLALPAMPYRGTSVTLDAKELGALAERDLDQVAPLELASWIIESRSDYRLIDLRSSPAYAAYHIPGAENVSIGRLADAELGRLEKIVLCSEDGVHAAQGWVVLRAMGFKGAYILRGGLAGWLSDVLAPVVPANATAEDSARIERLKAISAFFGGALREAGDVRTALPVLNLPKVEAPASAAGIPKAPAKKKKEGC